MRIAYIAAGMYCGSCIHDNTLAAALLRQGAGVALVPLYTPLGTATTVAVHDRDGLERLYREVNQPPLVFGPLRRPAAERLSFALKTSSASLRGRTSQIGRKYLSRFD